MTYDPRKGAKHDPLCPILERRATCQCALISAVEDRMFKEWADADAYQSSGLTT